MATFGTAIVMYPNGQQARVSLRKPTVRLGRSGDNDIVLEDALAAAHHAQIFCSPTGYQVLDLNSDVGTLVDNARLASYYPQPLADDSVIQIGAVRIFLYATDEEFQDEGGDVAVADDGPPANGANGAHGELPGPSPAANGAAPAPGPNVEVSLFPTEMVVDSGGAVIVAISVVNKSTIVEIVDLLIAGAPAGWATITPTTLPLFPGDKGEAQLVFFPPGDGSYSPEPLPFTISARSKQSAVPDASAAGTLTVRAGGAAPALAIPRPAVAATASAPAVPEALATPETLDAPSAVDPAAQIAALEELVSAPPLLEPQVVAPPEPAVAPPAPAPDVASALPSLSPPLEAPPLLPSPGLPPPQERVADEVAPRRRRKASLDSLFSQIADEPAVAPAPEVAAPAPAAPVEQRVPAELIPPAPAAPMLPQPVVPPPAPPVARSAPPPPGVAQPASQHATDLALSPTDLVVAAGEPATLTVQMTNRSNVLDRINLSVEGLPAEWVTVTRQNMPLFPGLRGDGQILIRPPREAASTAGVHLFKVVARFEQRPDEPVAVPSTLVILPYTEFRLTLYPRETTGRRQGSYLLVITNTGNQSRYFELEGRDAGHAVAFQFGMPALQVGPGESRQVPVRVNLRTWRWLTPRKSYPFMLTVTSDDKLVQEVRGTLHHLPPLPRFMLGRELAAPLPEVVPAEAMLVPTPAIAAAPPEVAPAPAPAPAAARQAPARPAAPVVVEEELEPVEPPPPPEPLVHTTLARRDLVVEAGGMVNTSISLMNRASIVDRIQVVVDGVPPAWVTVVPETIGMLPDDRAQIEIMIRPPREPSSTAGPHPLKIIAVSEQRPEEKVVEEAVLTIKPYTDFKVDIFPQVRYGKRSGTFMLEVANNGNQTQPINLDGIHDEDNLDFLWYPRTPIVPPGEIRKARVRVRQRKWNFVGTQQAMSFNIVAKPSDKSAPPQQLFGRLMQSPLLPMWLVTRIFFPLVLLAIAFAAGLPQKLWKSINGEQPAATTPGGASGDAAAPGGLQPTSAGAGAPGATTAADAGNNAGAPIVASATAGANGGGAVPAGGSPAGDSDSQGVPVAAQPPSPTLVPPSPTLAPTTIVTPTLAPTPTATLVPPTPLPPTATALPQPIPSPTRQPAAILAGQNHWTPADGIFYLGSDYLVPAGSTLTIDPGVEVRILSNARLLVDGVLYAGGDAGNPVRFSSADGSLWSGLYVSRGGFVQLTGVEIRQGGADGPVLSNSQGTLSIRDSLITENAGGLLSVNGNVELHRSTMTRNALQGAALAIFLGEDNSASLVSNIIHGNSASLGAALVHVAIERPRTWLSVEGNFFSESSGPNLLIDAQVPYTAKLTCNTFRAATVGLNLKTNTQTIDGFGVLIQENSFEGHITRGVAADLPFDVRGNWWADPSGPYEGTRNPNGRGNWAGVNLIFEPWLLERPDCTPLP